MSSEQGCRLCHRGDSLSPFHADKSRKYLSCGGCHAIFVPDEFVLPASAEKAEYDKHENFNEDEGYKQFLSRAITPLPRYIPALARPEVTNDADPTERRHVTGLDFGCGPNPLLAKMMSRSPYNCAMDYVDKYYFPHTVDLATTERTYDFVTATEVFEHLHDPLAETQTLWRVLAPGGVLVVMTKRATGTLEAFRNWHYIRDPTHIVFFTDSAFRWLADYLSQRSDYLCTVTFEGKDVAVLRKHRQPKSHVRDASG